MNEALRLEYLDAMGITQYVARAPLPGARPSPVLQDFTDDDETETATGAPSRLSELLGVHALQTRTEHEAVVPQSTKTVGTVDAVDIKTAATPAQSAQPVFQCRMALWTTGDLLVIADAPRLENNHLNLLRNILHAIGRSQLLSDVTQFTWPIPQRKDKSIEAARDHFQGLLDGGLLKRPSLRQILCFGDTVAPLLSTGDSNDTSPLQYQHWPVIQVCALHDMLTEPMRKADTWRTLKILVTPA